MQIGNLCARQKDLLHVAQVAAAEREGFSLRPSGELDDSGMMVLFVKHVHLQNEGGAGHG